MPVIQKQSPTNHAPNVPAGQLRKKTGGVLDRIAPVKLEDRGIKLSIYGKSGSGKTVLACSAEKSLLLIGAEDGTKSVHNVKGVDFVRLNSSGELTELSAMLEGGSKYKTVVLDTASALQDLVLKEILGIDKLPAQRSWGMADQRTWGQCALETKERLRSLTDLPRVVSINVIIIAQERNFKDESASSDLLAPVIGSALTPSVTTWLNAECDYICQTFLRKEIKEKRTPIPGKKDQYVTTKTETGKVEWCLRTGPSDIYTGKFRIPKYTALPDVIVDPDFSKIEALIRGEKVS